MARREPGHGEPCVGSAALLAPGTRCPSHTSAVLLWPGSGTRGPASAGHVWPDLSATWTALRATGNKWPMGQEPATWLSTHPLEALPRLVALGKLLLIP